MLRDKRSDLDAEKQKKLLLRLVQELSALRPDLYYVSTAEVARQIQAFISETANLNSNERTLLDKLSQRDVEVLLSLH